MDDSVMVIDQDEGPIPPAHAATIRYLRDLEARQVGAAALLAENSRLRAENARLRAHITRGHDWRRAGEGREYACPRCGLRAIHPARVAYSCSEWRRRQEDGRRVREG